MIHYIYTAYTTNIKLCKTPRKALRIHRTHQHVTAQYKLLIQSRSSRVQQSTCQCQLVRWKSKKMWCVILVQSVILSAMCLDVWLHGSNKHTEIPRYEVLRLGFAHTSTQMRTLRALATAVWQMDTVRRSPEDFKWSTDRVHLSYSAACYRNGTMQLLVRTKILDHRVRFDRFLTTFVHAFSFVRIAATFIFISFSFCVPPLVLVFVI